MMMFKFFWINWAFAWPKQVPQTKMESIPPPPVHGIDISNLRDLADIDGLELEISAREVGLLI